MKLFRVLYFLSSFKKGDFIKEVRIINQLDLDAFSKLTGDHNQIHKNLKGNRPMIHGAFLNSIVAAIIGTKLPGNGSIVVSQNFKFPSKCFANDPIEFYVELLDVRKIIQVHYKCTQNNNVVFKGDAKLIMNKKMNNVE
ncbi:hypothetical protein PVAND_009620 [Polypedilum vanderplanki]|uniref:Hydroxyacyl-thioester dehydratase type 2 n=1 Tax=Polypedilum vanderplanki TaxID=319348 RepID=A0A9J6CEP6_POLVA|nr:hypothetical protein PVAND_009620 [Polypedilum vanderplanki]